MKYPQRIILSCLFVGAVSGPYLMHGLLGWPVWKAIVTGATLGLIGGLFLGLVLSALLSLAASRVLAIWYHDPEERSQHAHDLEAED